MFFHLFKQKRPSSGNVQDKARDFYARALGQVQKPFFYEKVGVPDTFDGRFDLLLLHIFVILHRLMGESDHKDLSQALFDVMFRDMDQTLREMGIGDMGVPKHMRKMMKAFNGRMHAYEMAIDPKRLEGIKIEGIEQGSLADVLRRNLYGTLAEDKLPDSVQMGLIERYVRDNLALESDGFVEIEDFR